MLQKLKLFVNHQRYQVIMAIVIAAFLCWFQGCESRCQSMLDPGAKVTRVELKAEYDLMTAKFVSRITNLDQQEAFKSLLSEQVLTFAETGTVNPIGLIAVVFGLFGIGATVDNLRRRKSSKLASSIAGSLAS